MDSPSFDTESGADAVKVVESYELPVPDLPDIDAIEYLNTSPFDDIISRLIIESESDKNEKVPMAKKKSATKTHHDLQPAGFLSSSSQSPNDLSVFCA